MKSSDSSSYRGANDGGDEIDSQLVELGFRKILERKSVRDREIFIGDFS
jgi:hypothetical protein